MRIGADYTITAIASTSENAEYPDDNALDGDIKNPWRAASAVNDATLTIDVDAGTDIVGVFGIENGTQCVIKIYNSLSVLQETFTQTISDQINRAAACFTALAADHTITIQITGPAGQAVGAGVVWAADSLSLPKPRYGWKRDFKDFSVMLPYKTGGYYFKQRARARQISGALYLTPAQDEDIQDVLTQYGPRPLMIIVVDDTTYQQRDAIYGSIGVNGHPAAGFGLANFVDVNFQIEEMV